MELKIDTTITFQNLIDNDKRVSQHIGGTRSGKTYAILQYLIYHALQYKIDVTVVRKTIPLLKRTVVKDFKEILQSLGIWKEVNFNISDRIWIWPGTGSQIQFVSVDDPDKLRGIKSNILFIDEASEVDEESYFQLSIRTTDEIILAYNPTVSPYHWLRKMQDCNRYVTTYKDNLYLDKHTVKAIEDLQNTKPKYWQIYGLGEFAANDKAIFDFGIQKDFEGEFVAFGLDWGFSQDPTAVVAVYKNGNKLFLEEVLYETHLTISEIADKLNRKGIDKSYDIICDSSEPRSVEELYRLGFNAKAVKKGPDSKRFGIQVLQDYDIYIEEGSQNLINEMYAYEWETDKYGYATQNPNDGLDHLIDSARYVAMMKLSKKAQAKGQYTISIK